MHTLQLFIYLVQNHRYLGYTVLFFAMIFEGELFLVATGMLVNLGAFDPFDAFFFAFAGVLLGDILWYGLGRYLNYKHSHRKFVSVVIKKVRKILPNIQKNPAHVIFISKFIYGLNHSTILVLGYLKIGFRQFFRTQFFTSLLWCVLFLVVGFIFGAAALTITHSFNRLALVGILLLLALIFIERKARKYIIGKVEI